MNVEAVKSSCNKANKAFFDGLAALDTNDEKLAYTVIVSSAVRGIEAMLNKLQKMLANGAAPVAAEGAPKDDA